MFELIDFLDFNNYISSYGIENTKKKKKRKRKKVICIWTTKEWLVLVFGEFPCSSYSMHILCFSPQIVCSIMLNVFSLSLFKKETLLRCDLHNIKFTLIKYITHWFLIYLWSCTAITIINFRTFSSFQRVTPSILVVTAHSSSSYPRNHSSSFFLCTYSGHFI